ncbi:MAG: nitrile hydratase subunit beta [Rhodospirillales bacterium]|jgi:nitrile hydratase
MNGVHDMGGMHGLGPIVYDPNEPVFHASWEGRVRGMVQLIAAWGLVNIDAGRHSLERLPPVDYLRWTYFEKWLAALTNRMLDAGQITAEELANGRRADGTAVATPPITGAMGAALLASVHTYTRDIAAKPLYADGDRVRARTINPEGHTRLPRYARGRFGVVTRYHGAHVYPDTNAHFAGEAPQPLYTVRFTARELWGEAANAADTVSLDLWEDYLERA